MGRQAPRQITRFPAILESPSRLLRHWLCIHKQYEASFTPGSFSLERGYGGKSWPFQTRWPLFRILSLLCQVDICSTIPRNGDYVYDHFRHFKTLLQRMLVVIVSELLLEGGKNQIAGLVLKKIWKKLMTKVDISRLFDGCWQKQLGLGGNTSLKGNSVRIPAWNRSLG